MLFQKRQHNFVLFLLFLAAFIFYVYYGIYKMIFVNIDSIGADFGNCLHAVNQFFLNDSIYDANTPVRFMYPPLSLIIFSPFHFMDSRDAVILWYIISNMIIFMSAIILFDIQCH